MFIGRKLIRSYVLLQLRGIAALKDKIKHCFNTLWQLNESGILWDSPGREMAPNAIAARASEALILGPRTDRSTVCGSALSELYHHQQLRHQPVQARLFSRPQQQWLSTFNFDLRLRKRKTQPRLVH